MWQREEQELNRLVVHNFDCIAVDLQWMVKDEEGEMFKFQKTDLRRALKLSLIEFRDNLII